MVPAWQHLPSPPVPASRGPWGKRSRVCRPHLKAYASYILYPRRTPLDPTLQPRPLGSAVSHLGLKSLSQLMEP